MTKILSTLPSKYRSLRQAWLSLDPHSQTIQNLTARLLDEEASLTNEEESESALVAMKHSKPQRKFQNHNMQKISTSGQNNQHRFICYNCNKRGHFARDCRAPKKSERKPQEQKMLAFSAEQCLQSEADIDTWILDSGASAHMSYRRDYFSELMDYGKNSGGTTVRLGNKKELVVQGCGNILINRCVNGKWEKSILEDVLYVPELRRNLFSEGMATRKGYVIIKKYNEALILKDNTVVMTATLKQNNLYEVNIKTTVQIDCNVAQSSLKIWHERLGHLNLKEVKNMSKNGAIPVKLTDDINFVCEGCQYGKRSRLPFHKSCRGECEPVGYENENYRMFDIESGKITISRNVHFNENNIPVLRKHTTSISITDEQEQREGIQDIPVSPGDNQNISESSFESVETQEDSNDVTYQPPQIISEDDERNITLRPRRKRNEEANFIELDVPTTYEEAINCKNSNKWKEAICEELESLKENKTWKLVNRNNEKTVTSKWVFCVKRNSDGDIERYKARLCARGFTQTKNVDYKETFSPTTRFDSIRIILSLAARENYELQQFDVKTAFLYGELSEDVYMEVPEGVHAEPRKIYIDSRKSNTGYIFMMNGGPVSWASRKQNTVALSTTESEYMAASEAAKEILWLRQLLIDIDEPQLVITLCIDNQSAIKLIHNPIYHKRTKHIDIRYNFIREKVEQNVINVQYVKSSNQLADFLTKALPSGKFILNRDQVLNIN
ncbi:unnamed protein product [Parnassius mnemosyne]|uniref:CCHC-type domain-containing protein n=1 Tax=Parnassius mnemosyne TaxID=213953 RepID=A0AAV1LIA6_9NEOP